MRYNRRVKKIKGRLKMNHHDCTQEARIDLLIEMIKEDRKVLDETRKDVKFLVNKYHEQQGRIAIISLLFVAVGYLISWFFKSR